MPPRLSDYPDGIGRTEAMRRLLALAEAQPRPLWSLAFWWRRLAALVRAWRA